MMEKELDGEVIGVLNNFLEAYRFGQIEEIMPLFLPDAETIYKGILKNPGSVFLPKESLKREFEKFRKIGIKNGWKNIICHENTAVLTTDTSIDFIVGEEQKKLTGNITMVVCRNNSEWKILFISFGTELVFPDKQ